MRTFVLAGQSNMVGRAYEQDLPEELRAPFPAVRFFYDVDYAADRNQMPPSQSGGWVDLQPQPKRPSGQGPHFGPELMFGRCLADARPEESFGIIKAAYGGTHLAEQWNPDARDGLRLYARMLEVVAQAKQAEPSAEIVGFAWLQGESDASDPSRAAAYRANFQHLIARLRQDLQCPDLPVVILEFARNVEADAEQRKREDDIVRDLGKLAQADANIQLIRTDDLAMGDRIHWNTEGQLEAGRRLAEVMSKVQQGLRPC